MKSLLIYFIAPVMVFCQGSFVMAQAGDGAAEMVVPAKLTVGAPDFRVISDVELPSETELNPEDAFDLGAGTTEPESVRDRPDRADVAELRNKPEAEIPVFTSAEEKKEASSGHLKRLFWFIGFLTVLLGIACWAIRKWIHQKSVRPTGAAIKVLTQQSLGSRRSIALVQVAGESLLIGVTDHHISMLKTLTLLDEEVPDMVPHNFDQELDGVDTPNDDFTIHGLNEVRDVVSKKLKTMRKIQ